MVLQAHVSEVQRYLLTHWQPDQIDTLSVVGIIIGPVGGDDYAVTVSECTTTPRVTYNKTHSTTLEAQTEKEEDFIGLSQLRQFGESSAIEQSLMEPNILEFAFTLSINMGKG